MLILQSIIFICASYMTVFLASKFINAVAFKRSYDATAHNIIVCVLWGIFYYLTH